MKEKIQDDGRNPNPHVVELEKIRKRLAELERDQQRVLFWRDIPEDVETRLRDEMPVLIHEPDLDIPGKLPSDQSHILIEGDNLHALHVLQATHQNAVDIIYIDPPYNRGKDLMYNDKFVDKEDPYRHSKWLSFMSKRLSLAAMLLSSQGVLIVSIDDNEQARLKLLLDQHFGESNFVGCLPTVMNLKGNQDEFGFAGTHEYTLVYAKDKSLASFGQFDVDEETVMDEWQEDEFGWWKKGAGLKATGEDGSRKRRPNLWYPLFVSKDGLRVRTERKEKSDAEIWPITEGKEMRWRWEKATAAARPGDLIAVGSHPDWTIYKKQRPELGDMPQRKPKSLLYKAGYSTTNGTNLLKRMLGDRAFPNPKPLDLLVDLIGIASNSSSIVLDFFAGSGTTTQAVATLNARDAGNRRCILITNNESNICREVTHPRINAALNGKWADKEKHDPLPGSLSFYKTGFIKRLKSPDRMRTEIAKHTVDLIAIKEGAGTTVSRTTDLTVLHGLNKTIAVVPGLDPDHVKLHANAEKKVREGDHKIVYLFTWSNQGVEEETAGLWPGWVVEPLPSEMLAALRRNAPSPRLFDVDGGSR